MIGWLSAQETAAQGPDEEPPWDAGVVWRDDLAPAWASMEPVTFTLRTQDLSSEQTWQITQHNVTIIFPGGAVSAQAVFTFTPQLPAETTSPYGPTSYFYRLEGTYFGNVAQGDGQFQKEAWTEEDALQGNPVSLLKRIEIHLGYDEAGLLEVQEDTLIVLIWDNVAREWRTVEDLGGISAIDTSGNEVLFTTRVLQLTGLAGYNAQRFLPIVSREGAFTLSEAVGGTE
jgi:hypothetical protein